MTSLVDALREHLAKDPDIQGTDKHTRDQILDSMALSRFRQSSNNDKALSMALDTDDTLEKLQDFIELSKSRKSNKMINDLEDAHPDDKDTLKQQFKLFHASNKDIPENDLLDLINQSAARLAQTRQEAEEDANPSPEMQERNAATLKEAKGRWADADAKEQIEGMINTLPESQRSTYQDKLQEGLDAGMSHSDILENNYLTQGGQAVEGRTPKLDVDSVSEEQADEIISNMTDDERERYEASEGDDKSDALTAAYDRQQADAETDQVGDTEKAPAETTEAEEHSFTGGAQKVADKWATKDGNSLNPNDLGQLSTTSGKVLADGENHKPISESKLKEHIAANPDAFIKAKKRKGKSEAEIRSLVPPSPRRDHEEWRDNLKDTRLAGLDETAREQVETKLLERADADRFKGEKYSEEHRTHDENNIDQAIQDVKGDPVVGSAPSDDPANVPASSDAAPPAETGTPPPVENAAAVESSEDAPEQVAPGAESNEVEPEVASDPEVIANNGTTDQPQPKFGSTKARDLAQEHGLVDDDGNPHSDIHGLRNNNNNINTSDLQGHITENNISPVSQSAAKVPEQGTLFDDGTAEADGELATAETPTKPKGDGATEVVTDPPAVRAEEPEVPPEESAEEVGDPSTQGAVNAKPQEDANATKEAAEAARKEARAKKIERIRSVPAEKGGVRPEDHADLDDESMFPDSLIHRMFHDIYWNPRQASTVRGEGERPSRADRTDRLLGVGKHGPKEGEEDTHVRPLNATTREDLDTLSDPDFDKFEAEHNLKHIRSKEATYAEDTSNQKRSDDARRIHDLNNTHQFPNLDEMHEQDAVVTHEHATNLARQLHAHWQQAVNNGDFDKLSPQTKDVMHERMQQTFRHGADHAKLGEELEKWEGTADAPETREGGFGGAEHMAEVEAESAKNNAEDSNYHSVVAHGPFVTGAFSDTNNKPNSFITHNEDGSVSHATTGGKKHDAFKSEAHPHGGDVRAPQPVHLDDLDPASRKVMAKLHEDHHELTTNRGSKSPEDISRIEASIAAGTKHLADRGVKHPESEDAPDQTSHLGSEHLGHDAATTRLNRINSMMPDTPSATPNATSYHPHSGYHINTDVHKKMTKGLKDGESVHVPNPEAHHIDGVALGQATGAASTGGVLVTKNGIHPVGRHDPRQHNTAEAHGPLTSRDIIAGHLGQQMHQLHEDNPDQAASTAMHIPRNHPATSAVHNSDHPAVTPSSGGTGSKPFRTIQPWGAVARFAANRSKGAAGSAARRVATGVSNRAEGKTFWSGKDQPPSMTQKYHGFMRNNFPGYQPGMNPKQAVSTALKVTGDNIKASKSMRSRSTPTTTNAPLPRADATSTPAQAPQQSVAPKVSAPKKSGPGFLDRSRMRSAARAKANAAKAKAAPKIETEAAPKVETKAPPTTPLSGGGGVGAKSESHFPKNWMSPGTPGSGMFSGSTGPRPTLRGPNMPGGGGSLGEGAVEKMLTFMKSTNYVVSSQGKMSAAYWADKEKW